MANAVRARVELKKKYNEPWKNFKEMFYEFKRRVSAAGVMHEYREHENFESKSRKRRKVKREAQKRTLMESLTRKILAGERVLSPASMVKKIVAKIKKDKADMKKDRQNGRHGDGHYEGHAD